MGLSRAQRLARQTTQWPWEIRRGNVVTLPSDGLRGRVQAARLTLLVEGAATAAGAWVSTEAVVRVQRRPATVLRPVLAVVKAEPTYDGVLDAVPLLVIDVGEERRPLWPAAAAQTIWIVQRDVVVVEHSGVVDVVGPAQSVRAAGLPGLRISAELLCRMAAPPPSAAVQVADRGREEATTGHPH